MRTIIIIIGLLSVLVSLNYQNCEAQQLGEKVYWMVTTEVSLGNLPEYYVFSEKELVPLMEKHGYHFIAGWQTIIGDIEEVISVSEFESMSAYHKARKSLLASEEWKTTSKKQDELIESVRSRFLSALPYSRMN